MPTLILSPHTARVTWLGCQPVPVEKLVITSQRVQAMPLTFAGYVGEIHSGLTRPSCSRVTMLYPRDTEIRNVRQLSIVSAEEMAEVARDMGLEAVDRESLWAWVGASLVLEGIPDLTHLPPSSRLQGPDGVTLVVDMENLPCQEPAVTIEQVRPGQGKGFKPAATGKRGVMAWVEREGILRLGDEVKLLVPAQRHWRPGT